MMSYFPTLRWRKLCVTPVHVHFLLSQREVPSLLATFNTKSVALQPVSHPFDPVLASAEQYSSLAFPPLK